MQAGREAGQQPYPPVDNFGENQINNLANVNSHNYWIFS